MNKIIDGRGVAHRIKDLIQAELSSGGHHMPPGLAIVQVGHNPASDVYVLQKIKQSKQLGLSAQHVKLAEAATQDQIIHAIQTLNKDDRVHGIILQLPLPPNLDAQRCLNAIDDNKDVDGLTLVNAGRLSTGVPGLLPCTPLGCVLLLKDTLGDLSGKHVTIVGRSNLVGKPLAQLLLNLDCTLSMVHAKTPNPSDLTRQADIVISAAGHPDLIQASWIKPGAVVLDVGITKVDGRLKGDVAFDEVLEKASALTPVPGGVGPMTVACLMLNTVVAMSRQRGEQLTHLSDDTLQVLSCH